MDQYHRALISTIIVGDEGGWKLTDNPHDRGGLTYAGVTAKWFTRWYNKKYGGDFGYQNEDHSDDPDCFEPFAHLAHKKDPHFTDLIYEYYEDEFIIPLHLNAFPDAVHKMLLSCAVNFGALVAAQLLQIALNQKYFNHEPLIVDGKIGRKTVARFDQFFKVVNTEESKQSQIRTFKKEFCKQWIYRYGEIVINDATQGTNFNGWINRVWKYLP